MRIMLFYSIIFVLLSNAVTSRRDKSILYSRITIIKSFIICYIIYELLTFSLNESIGLFAGLFHITSLNAVFQLFIVAITGVILHLTAFYPRKVWNIKILNILYLILNSKNYKNNLLNKMAPQYKIIEYPLLLLFIITGANLLVSCSDIVSIFLSIELQSYGLYLLCSLYRNSELSTSAGLTYFLLGGLSSCFILLGLSLLYINSGTTNLDSFYVVMNLSNLMEHNIININYLNYMYFSLIIMSIGFLFKISAAPFHFWSPDVYDAIPTIVTTFVAIIAKISILVFLLEIIHYTSDNTNSFNWTIILLYSSLLSLIIGTVLGLNQFRIKRLFAYSTISHLGFILLALSINSLESIQAFTFYLMQYSLSNLNAFILLIAIGYSLYLYTTKKEDIKEKSFVKNSEVFIEKDNSPVQFTSQLKGFFYINPILSLSLAITIYSFVGIPPLVGFFAKQMVLSSAITNGYIFITFIAILSSVISAVYYLGIIKQLFFDKANYIIDNKHIKDIANNNVSLSSSISIIISILTLIILLFMLNAQEWLSLTNVLSLSLFNL